MHQIPKVVTRSQSRRQEEEAAAASSRAAPQTSETSSQASDRKPQSVVHKAPPFCTPPTIAAARSTRSTARSNVSTTSSLAKRKQLELEAAKAKAAIQIHIIDKELETKLAHLDAEEQDDVSSQSVTQEKVEQWLENSQVNTCAAAQALSTTGRHPDESKSEIQQLALTLKEMMAQSCSQREDRLLNRLATPRDLPSFGGDYVEWLHFKSAYHESTQVCNFSDSENLWRLRKSLRGEAKEAVTNLLIGNTPPSTVMNTLELMFGRSDMIITKLTAQLKKLAPLSTNYQHGLIEFSVKISNAVATICALDKLDYLKSPELMNAVISKLPSSLLGKWTDYAYNRRSEDTAKLALFAEFLKQESEMLLTVGAIQPPESRQSFDSKHTHSDVKPRERHNVFSTTCEQGERCPFCKKAVHLLRDCRAFRRALRKDRWSFVRSRRLCYCCLLPRHDNACSVPVCDIDNCGLPHNRLLHYNKPATHTVAATDMQTTPTEPSPSSEEPQSSSTVAHVASECDSDNVASTNVMLKVVEVKLRGPTGIVVITYALLDDGASVSIIDSSLADELALVAGESCAVKFTDAFGIELLQSDAPKVTVDVSGMDMDPQSQSYSVQFRKVSKLNLPMQNLSIIDNLQCKHLLHLKDRVCQKCVKPRLIIGEDNYYLLAPLNVIHGSKNEPYATQCRLGWCIHGHSGRTHSRANHNVFHLSHSEPSLEELNKLIKDSFAIDSIGISTSRRENTAHIRALDILDNTSRQVNDQWEVGLPFKDHNVQMPDSYDNALSRIHSLNRKFSKDSTYANRYATEMHKLFDEGYARELSGNELTPAHGQSWYLPHFGVQNPNKPGKLRLVFDAAARVKDLCLNDFLLTGPDLYNSLFGIMLRFRTNPFVIVGDIKDMFLRIKIRHEDQHVLRFLWQEPTEGAPLKVCTMQSLIFGATCSPFVAQYVKNKNALRYEDLYPEAVSVIVNSHYMDDCLYSTSSAENAIKLVKEITEIHKSGGFEIRGWISNSKMVLDKIPADSLAQSAIKLKDGATNITERALGLMWHPSDDTSEHKKKEKCYNGPFARKPMSPLTHTATLSS